jgi:Arc/MetJ-type ribon-helix-helix transcriptional regulator
MLNIIQDNQRGWEVAKLDAKDAFIGLRLPVELVYKIDREIEQSLVYKNRSDFIRLVLQDYLKSIKGEEEPA